MPPSTDSPRAPISWQQFTPHHFEGVSNQRLPYFFQILWRDSRLGGRWGVRVFKQSGDRYEELPATGRRRALLSDDGFPLLSLAQIECEDWVAAEAADESA